MAKRELMGWEKRGKRWVKRYKGTLYYVSPQKLGCPPTKEGSREKMNQHWVTRMAEIDAADEDPEAKRLDGINAQLEKIVAIRERQVRAYDAAIAVMNEDEQSTPNDYRIGLCFDMFLAQKLKHHEEGAFGADRYSNYRNHVKALREWINLDDAPLDILNATLLVDLTAYFRGAVKKRIMSWQTAKARLGVYKQFIQWLYESELIEHLPRNIDNPAISIKSQTTAVRTMDVAEVCKWIADADGLAELYLLLMANCLYGHSDIAALRWEDWKDGAIEKPRVKTGDWDNVPTTYYKLWPQTQRLLKEHKSNDPNLVLVSRNGTPVAIRTIVDGKLKNNNAIRNMLFKLGKKMGYKIEPKMIRKCSANLIDNHRDYGRYASYFLGHAPRSIKDRHYATPTKDVAAEVIAWLGEQYKQV